MIEYFGFHDKMIGSSENQRNLRVLGKMDTLEELEEPEELPGASVKSILERNVWKEMDQLPQTV